MLTLTELATIKAFMGETKNIDSYKRALAVVTLDDGNSIDRIGLSKKHAQRLRREFRKYGIAFKDKRHNNKTVLLAGAQREEVLVMLETTTPNDHGYTNWPFWSTRILASLIDHKYGVVYSSRTSYYVLFKKSGFSFHLPGKQYEKADYILYINAHDMLLWFCGPPIRWLTPGA